MPIEHLSKDILDAVKEYMDIGGYTWFLHAELWTKKQILEKPDSFYRTRRLQEYFQFRIADLERKIRLWIENGDE